MALAMRAAFIASVAAAAQGDAASLAAPTGGGGFPFPYNWSKFPTAWFAANATRWESEAQLAEIGKYSMAILGWQHLAASTHWTAIVYTQIEQAAIIKKAHPDMPVFVYSGFGFAAGFNNGTWPALESVLKDPKGSPFRDFFLQGSSKTVATQTYCQQGHTSTGATGSHCLSYVWNMANASARDYYMENVVAPLASSESIDGVFYDGFNWCEQLRCNCALLLLLGLTAAVRTRAGATSFRRRGGRRPSTSRIARTLELSTPRQPPPGLPMRPLQQQLRRLRS